MKHLPQHLLKLFLIVFLLILSSFACQAPIPASPPPKEERVSTEDVAPNEVAQTGERPDLVAEGLVTMHSSNGCIEAYTPPTSQMCAENLGTAPAGPFVLQVQDDQRWEMPGLNPGERVCFEIEKDFSGKALIADAESDIQESDEANNFWVFPMIAQPSLCTAVAEEPSQVEEPPAFACEEINYQGITFCLPNTLASSVIPENIPANNAAENPYWASPEHIQFSFLGYPLADTFHDPRLMIYPTEEFRVINPNAGDQIDMLKLILENKPAEPESIPFLPIVNASQYMATQVRYLDFQNGAGVRFLTQYGQAAWPVENKSMFYAFQGITSDGQYLVSAILPAAHPSLPDPETMELGDDFFNNFMDYLETVDTELSAEPGDSFSPQLDLLDKMMRSLTAASVRFFTED